MGGMVLPQEKEAIGIIRKLPENSLIVSTQRNHNLVKIYGDKHFVQITNQPQYDASNFDQTVGNDTDQAIALQAKTLKAMERVYESYNKSLVFNNFSKSIDSNTVKIRDGAIKLPLLEKYNPISYNLLADKLNYLDAVDKDIYFLYSFAKLDRGILATRDWWRISSDEANYNFFRQYSGPVVGKSDDYILIKIR